MEPWRDSNTEDYLGTFDTTKVRIFGWEYSVNGTDLQFMIHQPTHAVVWMRPRFIPV